MGGGKKHNTLKVMGSSHGTITLYNMSKVTCVPNLFSPKHTLMCTKWVVVKEAEERKEKEKNKDYGGIITLFSRFFWIEIDCFLLKLGSK